MVRIESLLLGTLTLAGCAGRTTRPSDASPTELVRAYEDALVAADTELPTRARTKADILLLSRARQAAAACVPGRSSAYPLSWLATHREARAHTSAGEQTVGAIAARCTQMLQAVEQRPVEACGARFVQIERHLDDDHAWSAPRVTGSSTGWYMTPCDRMPGRPVGHDLKDTRESILAACEDRFAGLFLLANWKDQAGGKARTATVACFVPRRERTDWLAGNPALGVK
jgi:hypothetical protein